MKKILLFALLAPPLGTLIFFGLLFQPSIFLSIAGGGYSFVKNLEILVVGFSLFAFYGYVLALFPALIVGIFASLLRFKNPIANYVLIIVFSMFTSHFWFSKDQVIELQLIPKIDDIFVWLTIITTTIPGYFSVFKMK